MYQLDIQIEEVSRYLGFGGNPLDSETMADIQWAVEQLRHIATPQVRHQAFHLDHMHLVGTIMTLEGKDITSLLQDCPQCILLAVTLGQAVDGFLRQLQLTHLTRALVADACASTMVEHLCDQVNAQLDRHFQTQSMHLTHRFSPGYGDLPLATQSTLCQVLTTQKTMGLAVTGAGILIPRKSITAILGVTSTPPSPRPPKCSTCNLASHCPYEKGGCGGV